MKLLVAVAPGRAQAVNVNAAGTMKGLTIISEKKT